MLYLSSSGCRHHLCHLGCLSASGLRLLHSHVALFVLLSFPSWRLISPPLSYISPFAVEFGEGIVESLPAAFQSLLPLKCYNPASTIIITESALSKPSWTWCHLQPPFPGSLSTVWKVVSSPSKKSFLS